MKEVWNMNECMHALELLHASSFPADHEIFCVLSNPKVYIMFKVALYSILSRTTQSSASGPLTSYWYLTDVVQTRYGDNEIWVINRYTRDNKKLFAL
jgi:hypothetical protein